MADDAPIARGPHPLSQLLAVAGRVTAMNRVAMAAFLAGLDRYQRAPVAPAMPVLPVVAQSGGVMLRRFPAARKRATAVVLVPSLINAPRVLDMAPGRSLLRFLAGRGHDVHLVDWGNGLGSERRLGLSGMVSGRLLPLLRRLGGPVVMIGYCMGGTMALAAAKLLGDSCHGLALLAAPWHCDGYAPDVRRRAAGSWEAIRPIARALGVVPISLLNPMFWSLDEAGVVAKYQRLGQGAPDDPALAWFAAVEDWANGGAPLSIAAARDLFVHGFGRDRIGQGLWRVGGTAIRPEEVRCPVLDVGAMADRIVPPGARLRLAGLERWDLDAGHVGMIVGTRAPERLWHPLSNWLEHR